jgi:hypothetical protein
MICGKRFWDAMRAAALALLLSSICQTPTLAANAIDTLAAQMSEASVKGRAQEGLAIAGGVRPGRRGRLTINPGLSTPG